MIALYPWSVSKDPISRRFRCIKAVLSSRLLLNVLFQSQKKNKNILVKVLLANKEKKRGCCINRRGSLLHTEGSHVSLLAFFFFAGFGAWFSSGFSAEKKKKNHKWRRFIFRWLLTIRKRCWLCCVGAETLFCLAVASASAGFCGTCVTWGFWDMLSFIGFSSLG